MNWGFHADFRNGLLSADSAVLADTVLNKIAATIVSGPVTYAGGAIDDDRRFFWHDGAITRRGRCGDSQGVVADLAAGNPYDGFRSRTLDAECEGAMHKVRGYRCTAAVTLW